MESSHTAVDQVISRFYSAFSNVDGAAPVDSLYEICLPEAVIVNATNEAPAIYSVREFAEPRRRLLASDALVNFRAFEISGDTDVHERIARRTSHYEKTWLESGTQKTGRGTKMFSLILMPSGWKIASVVWRDVT